MSGYDPNEDAMILSEGADYIATFFDVGAEWPTGTTAELTFPGVSTTQYDGEVVIENSVTHEGFTYEGSSVAFRIPPTDTTRAALPSGTRYRIHLVKNGVRYLWFRGVVDRQD